MARHSHVEAGSSESWEDEPLLHSADRHIHPANPKSYASVDVRAVDLVDEEDPETSREIFQVLVL